MVSNMDLALGALEHMRRARLSFECKICGSSISRSDSVLEQLRFESMFEYAEFFFTLSAMDLKDPGDIVTLADFHNQRIVDLTKDAAAIQSRGLRLDRLLKAIFTADIRPRLEQVWREQPGSFDQSNLARFLVTQMSAETTRKLTVACEAAGFVTLTKHPFKMNIVCSTGVMERIFEHCMLDMQTAIASLGKSGDANSNSHED